MRNNELCFGLNDFLVFLLTSFSNVDCFCETRQEFKCIVFLKLLYCICSVWLVFTILYFILSPNLFLSNLLTKNEDLTTEAGLSNCSKGTLSCSHVAQFELLTCCLKVMLQMAFLCMCMDIVSGENCLKTCAVVCPLKWICSSWLLTKSGVDKRILMCRTLMSTSDN